MWEEGDGGSGSHLLLSRKKIENFCTVAVKFLAVKCVFGWHVKLKKKNSLRSLIFCSEAQLYSDSHLLYLSTYLAVCCNLQPKGRAVSRLLESFAADEGFQMDGSSFSEGEDSSHSPGNKSPLRKTNFLLLKQETKEKMRFFHYLSWQFSCSRSVPNCVLSKELLTDGLSVLVSKEDELMYAARVHTLELPDM